MNNQTVAHKFFYSNDGSFDRSSMNVSFEDNKYYSYSTCVGQITEDVNGNKICIIASNYFSNTTSKHISGLKHACPYQTYELPQNKQYEFYADDIINSLKSDLEYYSKSKLTQKPNRQGLIENYMMLQDCLHLAMFKDYFKTIKAILKEYKTIFDSVNNPEKIKELKKIQAELDRKKQAKLKKQLNQVLKNNSYLELLEKTYTWGNYELDSEIKSKVKSYLNPKNEYSFVWFNGDYVKTSQSISVDKKEAIVLLKLWLSGKLKHGMKISYYTVLEVMQDYVKIGCHKIPVENIKALAKSLNLIKVAA